MALEVNPNPNPEIFQRLMGKGGMIMAAPRPVKQNWQKQANLAPDSHSENQAETREMMLQQFEEGKQASGYEDLASKSRQDLIDNSVSQIFQEAREQWSSFDINCLEAFKRGDRVGLVFENSPMFQPINQERLEMAMLSNQGSDESSIVDCFLKFVRGYDYITRDQFVWDWLVYHELHHGTGYGKTYKDHFNLVSYIRKHSKKYPDLTSRLNKLGEIAKEANSFGNGSLALVYPAYYYACVVGEEPNEFVRYVTTFTHTHEDAMNAEKLLCRFIENPRYLVEYLVPTESELKQLYCMSSQVTAYNTLLTALFIADVDTEVGVIRRGLWVGGDTDSTLATALLLWTLKQNHGGNIMGYPMRQSRPGEAAKIMGQSGGIVGMNFRQRT